MRLASFSYNGRDCIGAYHKDSSLVDLGAAWPAVQSPKTMIDLINLGEQGLQLAAEALEKASGTYGQFSKAVKTINPRHE